MTPKVSQIIADVKYGLELSPGPILKELLELGQKAKDETELPPWVMIAWEGLRRPEDGRGNKQVKRQ